MPDKYPVVTIQCDWNEALRLPKSKVWISAKYLNQASVHEELSTSLNPADNKIRIHTSQNFQYISHSNLSLILKHVGSGLKVVFVAPSKAHLVHKKGVLSAAAAENALMVSSCDDNQILVWDSRTSELLHELKGHGGPAYKCRFFPSGIVVLSAGADGSCRVWSAESGINPVTLAGHTMAVMDICIVDKGRNVISVSRDGTAKLWDVGESRCLANVTQGHGVINCCSLATSVEDLPVSNQREIGTGNKLLIIGCESGTVTCSQVASRVEVWRQHFESACNACAVVGESVVAGFNNGKILLLSLQTGGLQAEWHESANPVLSLAPLADQLFTAGRQDGTCTIYSTLDSYKSTRVQLTGSDCDGIRDISFNGKWIFTACRDSNVRKYDFNQVLVHFK